MACLLGFFRIGNRCPADHAEKKQRTQKKGVRLSRSAGAENFAECAENSITPMRTKIITKNEISYQIRGAIFKTYYSLGPGLLESTYQEVLKFEIEKSGMTVQAEAGVPLIHEQVNLNVGYRIDLLVEKKVLIEIK